MFTADGPNWRCEAAAAPQIAAPQPAKGKKDTSKVYTKEEVAKHKTRDSRIWVTHQGKVYDVSDWADLHPGGAQRLMLAAGGPLEPFWAMYQQHNQPAVRNILQQFQIGELEGGAAASQPVEDPYKGEPERHPILIVRTQKPFNAETPKDILAEHLITPNEFFFVRNHLPVPHVDASSYSLRIEGEGLRALHLSLEDLKTKFKKHSIIATLQCSGNRRDDMAQVKPIKGLDWDVGAIGTAVWGGVRLRDVLRAAGMDDEAANSEVQHIQFEGLDQDESSTHYGASIPIEKAVDPFGDVLLAYEMNGSPLPADHGYPVRVVVPGVTGARSVKWLARVVASKEESSSHWQQKDYKSFSPNVDWDNVDWSSAPALQETNVQSAITEPKPGAKVGAGMDLPVKGYAFSGGGRPIIRVDVSADGGKTWTTAELQRAEQQQRHRAWGWTLWNAEVPVPADQKGPVQLMAKATDSSYNSQPDTAGPIWNLRGVVNNAWHRVDVDAE
ncbi:hypothetical protein WJX72_010318 [[Myrmecia] bisecta]|uniref:sulfite oxidase n=1 Tax=[Myrmecia] bisecta TaxID=41462 RepID=A0AAW1QSJ4_9CHLO